MHVRRFGSILGALLVSTVGCELITSVDRSKLPDGTGGAGTGGAPECAAAVDCADPGNECLTRACTADGKCVPGKVAAGTPVSMQAAGDCQQLVCDGNGATTSQADDTDLPVDGKECTGDTCTGGVPSNPASAQDTPCGKDGALYCNGNGACVGCTGDAQCGAPTTCATPRCTMGVCGVDFVAPGTPIAAQTAGDCLEVQCDGVGGTKSVVAATDIVDDGNPCTGDVCVAGAATHPYAASGAACTVGGILCNGAGACVACLSGADCATKVCTAQVCVAATCADHVQNSVETDVDCGGPDCAPCADTLRCAVAGDCTSSVCSGSPLRCQVPICTDTTKNGTETDVDCGGAACPKCGPTKACKVNGDCKGASCVGNTCVPTCSDTVKNGTETGVDCGGSCATKCPAGQACGAAADCASGVCTGNLCVAPSCTDLVKNGTETGVDCGGGCGGCGDGLACSVGGDCTSGVCTGKICQMASCTDVVKNGNETDKDCGGGTCPGCIGGKICVAGTDCQTGICNSGICTGPSCIDNLKNGAETDVDCGGGTCPTCANGLVCVAPSDCQSGVCTAGTCRAVDDEPANNTCDGASPESLPANVSPLALPTVADVDWFSFTAAASDVGKVVHVITTGSGLPHPCDTVVEVFTGPSCAALVSLGGPSDDQNYNENWLSTALPAAGTFWVKVSYTTFGFTTAPYSLSVSTQ